MYLSINYSSWKAAGCFGVAQKQWDSSSQRTCMGPQQQRAAEQTASSTKEPLSPQTAELISPIVISQMIDENKSKGICPALPLHSTCPQPTAWHMKQSLGSHGPANLDRTLVALPSRLKIQAPPGDTTLSLDSAVAAKKQCPNQQKGFASITITARRVAMGFRSPKFGAGTLQEPKNLSPTSSKVLGDLQRWHPPGQATQSAAVFRISESCSQTALKPQKQLFDPGKKENSLSHPSSDGKEKVPPSFISCVHLQVSHQCPSTIYYLDKSLNVCIDQPRIKCQKIHRSTLSFTINCSSSRLTADGVDGIANGEPIEERCHTKLLGAKQAPLCSNFRANFRENNIVNKVKRLEGSLGSKYPWQSVFVSELPAVVDMPRGPNNSELMRKGDEKQSGSHLTVFALQLLDSSDEPGTQMLLGRQKQQCPMGRSSAMASGSPPDTASRNVTDAAPDCSLKERDLCKGTSKPKENEAQHVLNPKIFIFSSMCNKKASPRSLLEENVHRQNQLLKSDYEFCGSSDKMQEPQEEERQEPASRMGLPRTLLPDVPGEISSTSILPELGSQPGQTPPAPQTLQEALETHKPEFISRSQERLRKLQQMVQERKAQQRDAPTSNPGALVHKLSSTSCSSKKRQYTIPHPLSDNLFKPKERFIPEKEMHMRSKRIYDNLPEVKKKQEEKQKRIIIQSNRLRVEKFKKQLLDQLLQRNTE
ncbi:(E2-independent) E3 ubiquitin-conjugating enzyme FATS [Calypte anna]|uniref:(E2-independent) E3 ubiquitin-conjugating enzyme FATS n=1 Tax=Calypte anna TaxID=9244 RepID=UPI0011C485C0|nr:(E2-independent) E3 ubiquitin-conjugating enzyme FATS [Calypte anna]